MRLAHCRVENCSGHNAGRELLRQLYFEETGMELPPIHHSKTGQPYFLNSPYYFSITHTKNHAFCALSRYPIGIDAEELDRPVGHHIAPKVLSPSERVQYEAAENKNRALLTFWVLKEAEVKCSGQGLRGYPNHTAFSLEDPRVTERDGCLLAIITEENENAL